MRPPLCALCLLCLFLHLGYFGFLLFYHLFEELLAFFSSLCVDVEFLSLTIGESWEEASFPQCVVHLIHASRATLAYLRHVRLEFFVLVACLRYSWLIICVKQRVGFCRFFSLYLPNLALIPCQLYTNSTKIAIQFVRTYKFY